MIILNDNYSVNATSDSYILQEKVINTDKSSDNYGKITYKSLGYYATLESALKGFIKVGLRNVISKKDVTLAQVLEELQKVEFELKKLNLDI